MSAHTPEKGLPHAVMTNLDVSITIVLASLLGGCLWDAWLAIRSELQTGGDYCDGLRAVNKYTGGLFGLVLLALWFHVFIIPLLGWWR